VQKLELIEEYKYGTGLRGIVFGKVVLAHIRDEIWVDGKIDPRRLKVIGRVGSNLFCRTEEIFEMKAPKI
jgi:flavin reductase (DIM6/NTAB) family NADH-FMN oxidoreductase RutF